MRKRNEPTDGSTAAGVVALTTRVRVHPGTPGEARGVVVEDFGESAGQSVEIGDHRVAEPARRWAVTLDAGELVFVDDEDITPE